MLMKLRGKMQNQQGFTLVELMVVVVIIGVLVAIAVPIYKNTTENAANKAHAANVRTLEGAATTYVSTAGLPASDETWTGAASQNWDDYVQEWPTIPAGATKNADGTSITSGHKNYSVEITTAGKVTVTTTS